MNMNRILVIAAHPDDEVLGCGATINKLIQEGKELKILILGEGSTCRYNKEDCNSKAARDAIKQRLNFAQNAMKQLGVLEENVIFLSNPCGRFDTVSLIDLGKSIEQVISIFQPDTVFTHSAFDTNNDHRLAFQATIQATRPVPGYSVSTVLCYEVLTSSEWRFIETFKPNYFIDVKNNFNNKIKAFACYAATEGGTFPYPRSQEGLSILAKMRGMQVGLDLAEAFMVVRSIQK